MTVEATPRREGPYVGDDSSTEFSFEFKVFQDEDIVVTLIDITTLEETTAVLGEDYSVTRSEDQNDEPGGDIVFDTAPDTNTRIVITSAVEQSQGTDLNSGGGFYPETIEDALDRAVILIQELKEIMNRTLQLSLGSSASAVLPSPEALALIGWNAEANALVNYVGTVGVAVTAFMETVLGAADSEEARSLLEIAEADTGSALESRIGVVTGGNADSVILYFTPTLEGLDDMPIFWRAGAANTSTTPILTRDGNDSKTIVKLNGQALVAGDIPGAGAWMCSVYDAGLDKEVLLNPAIPKVVVTQAADNSTTSPASTAFVIGQAGNSAPVDNGVAAAGTSKKYSREDHVHNSGGTVASVNGQTGAVVSTSEDAIGCYMLLVHNTANTALTSGTTYAGSALRRATSGNNNPFDEASLAPTGSGLSGTWRAMSQATASGGGTYSAGLFTRVS